MTEKAEDRSPDMKLERRRWFGSLCSKNPNKIDSPPYDPYQNQLNGLDTEKDKTQFKTQSL